MKVQSPEGFTQEGSVQAMAGDTGVQLESLEGIEHNLDNSIREAGDLSAYLQGLRGDLHENGIDIAWAQDLISDFDNEPNMSEPSHDSDHEMHFNIDD